MTFYKEKCCERDPRSRMTDFPTTQMAGGGLFGFGYVRVPDEVEKLLLLGLVRGMFLVRFLVDKTCFSGLYLREI